MSVIDHVDIHTSYPIKISILTRRGEREDIYNMYNLIAYGHVKNSWYIADKIPKLVHIIFNIIIIMACWKLPQIAVAQNANDESCIGELNRNVLLQYHAT